MTDAGENRADVHGPITSFVDVDVDADTQTIPIGTMPSGNQVTPRPRGVARDHTADIPWVPQSLARVQGGGAESRQPPPPVGPPGPPPASRGRNPAVLAVISVLGTAVAIGAAAYFLGWVDLVRGTAESTAVAATASPEPAAAITPSPALQTSPTPEVTLPEQSTPATATPTTLSEEDLKQRARESLETIVDGDAALNPIRGQWVAQLASKYEGVVDLSQQPEPFESPEILDEVMRLRSDPEFGALVRVVHQGDWGGSEPGESTMWVTFADIDASTRDEVVSWCESRFSQRGQALLNVCYPREMRLP